MMSDYRAASVVAISDLSAKVAKLCLDHIANAKDARDDVERLANEVEAIGITFAGAHERLNDSHNVRFQKALSAAFFQLRELNDKLSLRQQSIIRRVGWRAPKWPYERLQATMILKRLEGCRQIVLVMLQNNHAGRMPETATTATYSKLSTIPIQPSPVYENIQENSSTDRTKGAYVSPYTYEPVIKGEIRVLNLLPGVFEAPIQCNLVRRSLSLLNASSNGYTGDNNIGDCAAEVSSAGYEALSYVWGDPKDRLPILCSGSEITVTRNLAMALKYLRFPDRVRQIWADAICINQNDNVEKGQQVQQMCHIYSSAVRVLAWLGEERQEDKDALEKLPIWLEYSLPHVDWGWANIGWKSPSRFNFLRGGVSDEAESWLQFQQVYLPPLVYLFSREWWHRKWIIQELALSKEAILIIGFQNLDWARVQKHLKENDITDGALQLLSRNHMSSNDDLFHASWKGMKNLCMLVSMGSSLHAGKPQTLLQLVTSTMDFRCSVAHDHLYALLGLASTDTECSVHAELLRVDYSASVATVSANLTRWYILNNLTEPLTTFNFVLGNRKSFDEDEANVSNSIPSWAVLFLQPGVSLRLDHVHHLGMLNFGGSRSTNQGQLEPPNTISGSVSAAGSPILSLRGRILCTITEILPCKIDPLYSCSSYEDVGRWTKQVWDWMCNRNPDPNQASEVFFQLLTCGGDRTWECPPCECHWKRPNRRGARRYLRLFLHAQSNRLPFSPDSDPDVQAFFGAISFAQKRHLCMTSTGQLGWAPPVARIGDEICVFPGDKLLYVIAPCGGGYHNLIGPCYIQNLMGGEALDPNLGVPEQLIKLY